MFSSDEARVHQALESGMEAYKALYQEAEDDFEGFWERHLTQHFKWI